MPQQLPLGDLDLDLLEPLLQQMVQLIGLPATMKVVEEHGGTLLNIPRQADKNDHLVALVGVDNAGILGRELGPDRLLIPKAGPALMALRDRQILAELQTKSVRQVARAYKLGERRVWQIKSAQEGPQEQPRGLFD